MIYNHSLSVRQADCQLILKQLTTPLICLITFALVTTPAKPLRAAIWECGERSNLPLEGKNYCAAGDFRQAEARLLKVLEALMEKHRIAFGDASDVSNAQNAFESYRDSQCMAENKRIEDKPFHPMIIAQCKTRLTNIRIDELKRMQVPEQ